MDILGINVPQPLIVLAFIAIVWAYVFWDRYRREPLVRQPMWIICNLCWGYGYGYHGTINDTVCTKCGGVGGRWAMPSSIEWRQSKFYGGKVAWFNGTLYRVTKINNNNYELESGGNFYKQWTHVGNASSMREAEDVCRIDSEGKPGDNLEASKDSTDN